MVKTYPTLSSKYAELVCTAGINEKGEWRRLYPIQFRLLDGSQKYKKRQYVHADTSMPDMGKDMRPETRVVNQDTLEIIKGAKADITQEFLNKVEIFEDMEELIQMALGNKLSLALFKPSRIVDFIVQKESEQEWSTKNLKAIQSQRDQLYLFDTPANVPEKFKPVNKLPYKFSYKFLDINNKPYTRMITDWEIGMLYWNCLKKSQDEDIACSKVRQKYLNDFVLSGKYETYLILGTTNEAQRRKWPNQFVIVGVVRQSRTDQSSLFS